MVSSDSSIYDRDTFTIEEGMTERIDLEATYHEYNAQIDSMLSLADGNHRVAARVVAWFFGKLEKIPR
jgi:hypothetical protein